ncbi:MAG TPA: hypothetical protein VHZ73_12175 [Vicinamibacterales bacterium]|nr:hypothetical protein [Vicinamibacterales bacterium]
MSTTTNKFVQPVLVGGLVMGTLSALPLVNAGNACCCLWVVSGGVVAAYFLQQNQHEPIATGDGAIAGLLAGLCGAAVSFVLSIPITIVLGPIERRLVLRLLEAASNVPPEARSFVDNPNPLGVAAGLVIGFIGMVFVGAIFSTLGGVLGAAIFRKTPSQPTVIDIPPAQ